eukprot:CAMPEP_0171118774 /NCGR_PEP_ID=MMETSP0766_2-20121228/95515_1 /TAXON_ID=439317 /ORGANISM="Gambierdiscus australes, Strain CAWD 149" /LENGTH=51 /DNA_ID=CAMNT_0011581385 /DNA_START=86 /DNA_END=237 /DNA_ORIENTATION=-
MREAAFTSPTAEQQLPSRSIPAACALTCGVGWSSTGYSSPWHRGSCMPAKL